MATKNSFFSPLWILLVLTLTSCSLFKTRDEIKSPSARPGTSSSSESTTSPSPVNPPPPVAPSKTHPKIGLLLGPGGMRAFAHLGFLEQLDKARIPVTAVTGIEWGALVAGLYSVQGKAYDAQWKMLKMSEKDLPTGGLFTSSLRTGSVDTLRDFFNTTISRQTIERSSVPFSCPSQNTQTGSVEWYTVGPLTTALEHCLPYAPLFNPKDNQSAAMFATREAADQLRRQGATLIVLVDVLADGGLMSAQMARENQSMYMLWLSVQNDLRSAKASVDEVFYIRARDKGLTDFAARRTLLQAGQAAGQNAVQYLTKKYGL